MPWTKTHGLRLARWCNSPSGTRIYLLGEYYRLLKVTQAMKHEYRDADLEELARSMPKEKPLPSWLARYGYASFLRRLITAEPSETTLYILYRRHGYKPHTIKRYITLLNRAADAAFAAAHKTPDLLHPK